VLFFVIFFDDLWVYVGINSFFSQRIREIYGRFEDLMLLKIGRLTPNSCPPTRGALSGAFNCVVVFQTFLSPFNPFPCFVQVDTPVSRSYKENIVTKQM